MDKNKEGRDAIQRNATISCQSPGSALPSRAASLDFSRICLSEHRPFTRQITRHIAGFFVTPVAAYAFAVFGADLLRQSGHVDAVATVLSYLLGMSIALGGMALIAQNAFRLADMHLAKFKRQSGFAAEAVFVDNQEHVREGIETLLRTWSQRLFLMRWFYDMKAASVLTVIFVFMSIALVNAYKPILSFSLLTWREVSFAVVVVVDIAATCALIGGMVRRAASDSGFDPSGPLKERLEILLSEVQDLRRGARLNR